MKMHDLDTPSLVVDIDKMERNLKWGQEIADHYGVNLRPHTKTHKTPALAKRQVELGAKGITVAKLGEAEVMADAGLDDIFVANEVVGALKLQRLVQLARRVKIAVGVDDVVQARAYSEAFQSEAAPLEVLIDIDTGDDRTGIQPGAPALELAQQIRELPGVSLRGIFAHEGHAYGADSLAEANDIFKKSQEDVLLTATMLRENGHEISVISIGATPPLLSGGEVLPGITEIRPGTYIFMDAAQANVVGHYNDCAVTILGTVVNRPTAERVVLDTGVKALTTYVRGKGICQTQGYGRLKENLQITIDSLSDEHGVFQQPADREYVIGEKVEIIPNHVCPACNLYEVMYGIQDGRVVAEWTISARGKTQ